MVIPDINIPDIDEDSSDDEDDEEEQKNILAIFQKLQQAKSSIEENKKAIMICLNFDNFNFV
jgi:hypothetical protein